MPLTLIIGGSGMLRGFSLALAREEGPVAVIARDRSRLGSLRAEAEGSDLIPISVDYRDSVALAGSIRDLIAEHGPIDRVVAWIHSTAPDALRVIATQADPRDLLLVLGSSKSDPDESGPRNEVQLVEGRRCRTVVTGFVVEDGLSRWLTHEEICVGVLDAVRSGRPRSVIGTLTPWSARP